MIDVLLAAITMIYLATLVVWLKWTRPSLGKNQHPISDRGSALTAQFIDLKKALIAGQQNKKTPLFVQIQIGLLILTAVLLVVLMLHRFV
jgi:hypothetical protein